MTTVTTPGTAVSTPFVPALLDLVAWRTGLTWSKWHIPDVAGRTRCGREIPTTGRLTRRNHLAADVCQQCIAEPLTTAALVEMLVARGFRVTVTLDDAVVAERDVLGVRHALRRVVAQVNEDGSLRVGYLFARPGQPGGPIYQHDLVARLPGCRDAATLARWLAVQDARAVPLTVA